MPHFNLEQTALHTFLSLYSLSPNLSQWSDEKFAKNPPRKLRWEQFQACLKALQLPISQHEFSDGSFIYERELSYPPETLRKLLHQSPVFHTNPETIPTYDDTYNLHCIYWQLMHYRQCAHKLTESTTLFLSAPDEVRFFIDALNKQNQQLNPTVEAVDSVLCFLINPHQISISRENLIAQYQFPDVDLDAIDADYA